MSEAIYRFRITYRGEALCTLLAHTKWEAIQKAYFKYADMLKDVKSSHFEAKKIS